MSAVLELRDLAVAYGGVLAVRGVSLSVEAGSIATVIGANGAGKSTLLNAIMGILPSQGHIGFAGVSLEGLPVEARVAAGLGLVPEKRELFSSMSVEDNLRLGAFLRRAEGRSAIAASLGEVFALFPRLRERRRQLAGTLSGDARSDGRLICLKKGRACLVAQVKTRYRAIGQAACPDREQSGRCLNRILRTPICRLCGSGSLGCTGSGTRRLRGAERPISSVDLPTV